MLTNGCSLKERTEKLTKGIEELAELAMKSSGYSMMTMLRDLDEDSGAVIGKTMELYNESLEFVVQYAEAMDNMMTNQLELKELVKELRNQNEQLREEIINLKKE